MGEFLDLGIFANLAGFFLSISWTHLYKIRRKHKRALVAVLVAVATVVVAVVAAVAVMTAASDSVVRSTKSEDVAKIPLTNL